MTDRKPSDTALMMAFLRGFHAFHDHGTIFNDTIAYDLIPDELREAFKRHLASTVAEMAPVQASECTDEETSLRLAVQVMAGPVLARARFTEDRLEEAVERGISQYIILGAGLDTFAYRRPDLTGRLQVFELDLSPTQEMKQLLLNRLNIVQPDSLHYIAVDLARQNLADFLFRSQYDPKQASFFSLMGVTQYLPLEAVLEILRTIAGISGGGSEIVFDYYDKSAFDPDTASNRIKYILKSTRNIGETIITGFEPLDLAADLAPLGLRLADNWGPEEIQEKCLRQNKEGYTASEHVHLARAIVADKARATEMGG